MTEKATKKVRDVKGFTILEVMIAMAILAIGILSITKLQLSATNNNTKYRLYTEKASQTAGWIEEQMNKSYENLDNTNTYTPTTAAPPANININLDRYSVEYIRTPQVTDPDISDSVDFDVVSRIDVTIFSDENNNQSRDANEPVLFTVSYYKADSAENTADESDKFY